MEETNYQERFDKFKDGVFKYIIKSDIKKMDNVNDISITSVELSDKFDVSNHTGKIYPHFIIEYKGYLGWSYRIAQERVEKRIKYLLKTFYPTNEFNILSANIEFKKL